MTYDTSMNSPGFGLFCDMKFSFYQKFIFFQAVFQEDKTSSEEKDYIILLLILPYYALSQLSNEGCLS